jgi:hypothetical protein
MFDRITDYTVLKTLDYSTGGGRPFFDTQVKNAVLFERIALNYRPSVGRPPDILNLTLDWVLQDSVYTLFVQEQLEFAEAKMHTRGGWVGWDKRISAVSVNWRDFCSVK